MSTDMNEDEALASLLEDIYGEDVATEEQQEPEQEAVEPVVEAVEVPQEPQFEQNNIAPVDTNGELINKLMQIQEQTAQQNQMLMQKLTEQQAQQNQPELSEEDMAIQELSKKLGLDRIVEENQMLKSQLQQIAQANEQKQQQEQMMQQQAQLQEEIRVEANKFMKEFPDIKPEVIIDYIKTQPADVQPQFDTPQGWRMIATILKSQATPTQQRPDAIVSTNSGSTPTVSGFARRKAGESVSDTDLAMELLNLTN